jgi:transcriptional regulator
MAYMSRLADRPGPPRYATGLNTMYVPQHFVETDPEALAAVIRDYNFGTLITAGPQGLFATHLPFVSGTERPLQRLRAHMAKANPHWQDIGEGADALAIFQGPHAYISPSWYVSRPRVPTWNYISVHVYGSVRLLTEPREVLDTLARTVAHQEDARARPWRMADLPESYLSGMAKNVVAVELVVKRVEGKFKLNQNMPQPDQKSAIAALFAEGDALSRATAEAMIRACGIDNGSDTKPV